MYLMYCVSSLPEVFIQQASVWEREALEIREHVLMDRRTGSPASIKYNCQLEVGGWITLRYWTTVLFFWEP